MQHKDRSAAQGQESSTRTGVQHKDRSAAQGQECSTRTGVQHKHRSAAQGHVLILGMCVRTYTRKYVPAMGFQLGVSCVGHGSVG